MRAKRDEAAARLSKASKEKARAKAAADAAATAAALARAAARSVKLAARAAADDDDASRRALAEIARADAAVARAERDGERWRAGRVMKMRGAEHRILFEVCICIKSQHVPLLPAAQSSSLSRDPRHACLH